VPCYVEGRALRALAVASAPIPRSSIRVTRRSPPLLIVPQYQTPDWRRVLPPRSQPALAEDEQLEVESRAVGDALLEGDLPAAFAALRRSTGATEGATAAVMAAALANARLEEAFTHVAFAPSAGPPLFTALLGALGNDLGGADAIPSDASVVAAFISAASRCGAFPAAAAAFEACLRRGERSPTVFNAYISACGRAGQPAAATAAHACMRAEGVRPSAVTFNALVAVHAAGGDVAGARGTLAAMREAGEVPNGRTYGGLLAACAAAGDARAGLQFFRTAQAERVAPNRHMVSSLLTALSRSCASETTGFPPETCLQLGWSSVAQLRAAGELPNAQTWSALASMCGRAGAPARALEVLRASGVDAHSPYVLCAVLTACRGSALHAAAALAAADAAPRAARTTSVMNAAIALQGGALGDLEGAAARAAAMASGAAGRHAAADTITFTALIAACAAQHDAPAALRAFDAMRASGVAPSQRTLAALTSAVGRGVDGPARAAALVQCMRSEHGLEANEYVYSALLDAHVKAGDTDGAFGALSDMRAAGITPTAVTFGILLDGCKRTADVERALGVAREMVAQGVPLSDVCANLLLVACSRAGLLDEMLVELRALARRGGAVEREALNAALCALCRFHYAERALRVRAFMAQRGMTPSAAAFSALAEAVAREGLAAAAYTVAVEAAGAACQLSTAACSAVVRALCRAGEVDQALWVASERYQGEAAPSQQLHSAPRSPARGPHPLQPQPHVAARSLSPPALAALASACARVWRVDAALALYEQLLAAAASCVRASREDDSALAPPAARQASYAAVAGASGALLAQAGLSRSERLALYSDLVQACCLQGRLDAALVAYDAAQEDGEVTLPSVTLAALEAACKRSEAHAHRVWDVCAAMRIARHAARQRKLAAPRKRCAHVAEA